jgi:hypothetical protein
VPQQEAAEAEVEAEAVAGDEAVAAVEAEAVAGGELVEEDDAQTETLLKDDRK